MAKYGKIVAWVGPIVAPMLAVAIRRLLGKGRNTLKSCQGDSPSSNRDMLDDVVDAGLAGLSRSVGRGMGGRK